MKLMTFYYWIYIKLLKIYSSVKLSYTYQKYIFSYVFTEILNTLTIFYTKNVQFYHNNEHYPPNLYNL